jgi:hypothetical protein
MQTADSFQFKSFIEESTNKLWGAHFAVPDLVANALIEGDDKRVVCTLNGVTEYQCALVPRGDGTFLITVNKKIRDQHKLKAGSPVDIVLVKDSSEYGLPMPEEMAELLKQDPEGDRLLHALTPGKIRTLLYIVGNVKSSDKRLGRAIAILEHLKMNGGKIDYRKLNGDLRDQQI